MSIIGKGQLKWMEKSEKYEGVYEERRYPFTIEDFQTFEDIAAIIYERSGSLVNTKVEIKLDPDWVIDVSKPL